MVDETWRPTRPAFQSRAVTHAGAVRTHNEDAFVDRPDLGLWAVADGAGGHESGEVASAAVAEALGGIPPGLAPVQVLQEVRTRLAATHNSLMEQSARRGPKVLMATTVVVLLAQQGHFACLWAGDSRVYLLRDGVLTQVSRDHSVVEDLLEAGAITAEQAVRHPQANIITRAVGAAPEMLDLDKRSGSLKAGDRFLLCSDGLCKALDDARIAELLAGNPEDGADRLIAAALLARATDNVTAVTVRVLPAAG
ncbi:serine/threonine-protein phosphatase [Roseomonas sp. SG15]|uniref:Serine/threonine-protein phosphatase n=2 Tax=Roseomonas indoligenes TaxID=2820811 RepID=A0A940MTR6_9PROT|nr:serine/threonine-protein phosphatase [Pararoseomonas indoligenes]